MKVSAVIASWNKKDDLKECFDSIQKQSHKVSEIIVVDNHSTDGTIEMIENEYPEVKLIVLPDSTYGACEALNIGFSTARYELVAILDDDITLPENWIEDIIAKFEDEPESTAMISTKVIEPDMPESYMNSISINSEKYIGTFVGCGSVIKRDVLDKAEYYDERFFIHVNERDLAARILNLGYKIKHYPKVVTYHKKPFGIHYGKRSLYYHVRNYIWCILKNYPVKDICKIAVNIVPRKKVKSETTLGTVNLFNNIIHTKNGIRIVIKAIFASMLGIPYCLKNRKVG